EQQLALLILGDLDPYPPNLTRRASPPPNVRRAINPDIFGSMFQAIVTPGKRSDLGQHYTSVPNILKTIEPLFLDDLKTELNEAQDSERRLMRLLDRITDIKVFDPAFMRKSGVSRDISKGPDLRWYRSKWRPRRHIGVNLVGPC
ncbi:hypothetical protein, partial [Microbacterium paraoxydans]